MGSSECLCALTVVCSPLKKPQGRSALHSTAQGGVRAAEGVALSCTPKCGPILRNASVTVGIYLGYLWFPHPTLSPAASCVSSPEAVGQVFALTELTLSLSPSPDSSWLSMDLLRAPGQGGIIQPGIIQPGIIQPGIEDIKNIGFKIMIFFSYFPISPPFL